METNYNKTSIRLGEFSLETSGPKDEVDKRVKEFYEFYANVQKLNSPKAQQKPVNLFDEFSGSQLNEAHFKKLQDKPKKEAREAGEEYDIFRVDNDDKIVLLARLTDTDQTEKVKNAILLLLHAYKACLNQEQVTIYQLSDSIKSSGVGNFKRLSFALDPLYASGMISIFGQRGGKKLKLNATGEAEAVKMAKALYKP